MLMHYVCLYPDGYGWIQANRLQIEEVQGVEQVMDQEEEISMHEFARFEEKLRQQKGAEATASTVGKGSLDTVAWFSLSFFFFFVCFIWNIYHVRFLFNRIEKSPDQLYYIEGINCHTHLYYFYVYGITGARAIRRGLHEEAGAEKRGKSESQETRNQLW